MSQHALAGQLAPRTLVENIPRLISCYYATTPDPADVNQRVAFGTSGHRGSAFDGRFNEHHILATTQAICEYRQKHGITGPLHLGMDTHALSEPAWITALEVLAAHGVEVRIDERRLYTPTPVLSFAIVEYNRGRTTGLSDGIVVTPSHNPPRDGGFKYNPPDGGPAGSEATGWIADRANEILASGWKAVPRVSIEKALTADTTLKHDYLSSYVADLANVIDVDAIRAAGVRIGADPLGGASVEYWGEIGEFYGLDLTVVNPLVDPAFGFMTLDWDGKIRMDCSSPYAMASLIHQKDKFQVATGNDADADRHGIVTPDAGLMNPNHYLDVAINYLFGKRPGWPSGAAIGKTLVSSSMIDRVAGDLGRRL